MHQAGGESLGAKAVAEARPAAIPEPISEDNRRRKPIASDELVEALLLHVLHHNVELAIRVAELVDVHDVGVLEKAAKPRLANEDPT